MSGPITVVGLGPAGPELITAQTRRAIEEHATRFLRTTRHPAAASVPDARSFDHLYEQEETLEAVYGRIVEELVEAAATEPVLYAVPGSPVVAERTVALLAARDDLEVRVLPAVSFADLAWARLGVDPVAAGAQLVDGRRFATEAAGSAGPFLVAQCDSPFVLSDVKLALGEPQELAVVVLQRLGLPDEAVVEVPWFELDRAVEPDHLTAVWIPKLASPVTAEVARLTELVATLRRECPWDREQTHQSLTRHLLEETYEVLEAIDGLDRGDPDADAHLAEELGDLLFQVVFHSTLAEETGRFTLAEVAAGVHDKLRARHPHVFADVEVSGADDVRRNWEQLKRAEKGRASVMDGMPTALPALLLASKVQRKAAGAGMDFASVEEVHHKVLEELGEVREDPGSAELGDLLFAVTGLAQHLGVDPEEALRHAARRFADRFRVVEALAAERDLDLGAASAAELDALWEEAKASVQTST